MEVLDFLGHARSAVPAAPLSGGKADLALTDQPTTSLEKIPQLKQRDGFSKRGFRRYRPRGERCAALETTAVHQKGYER